MDEFPTRLREIPDFIITDFLDVAEHSDRGVSRPRLIRTEFAFVSTAQSGPQNCFASELPVRWSADRANSDLPI